MVRKETMAAQRLGSFLWQLGESAAHPGPKKSGVCLRFPMWDKSDKWLSIGSPDHQPSRIGDRKLERASGMNWWTLYLLILLNYVLKKPGIRG